MLDDNLSDEFQTSRPVRIIYEFNKLNLLKYQSATRFELRNLKNQKWVSISYAHFAENFPKKSIFGQIFEILQRVGDRKLNVFHLAILFCLSVGDHYLTSNNRSRSSYGLEITPKRICRVNFLMSVF